MQSYLRLQKSHIALYKVTAVLFARQILTQITGQMTAPCTPSFPPHTIKRSTKVKAIKAALVDRRF